MQQTIHSLQYIMVGNNKGTQMASSSWNYNESHGCLASCREKRPTCKRSELLYNTYMKCTNFLEKHMLYKTRIALGLQKINKTSGFPRICFRKLLNTRNVYRISFITVNWTLFGRVLFSLIASRKERRYKNNIINWNANNVVK